VYVNAATSCKRKMTMGFNLNDYGFGYRRTMYDRMAGLVSAVGAIIFGAVLGLLIIALNAAIYAFPTRALWDWFVVPATHFQPLSYLGAMGMTLFASLMLVSVQRSKSDGYLTDVFNSVVVSSVLYFLGFVIHYYM
jgi:hypothetical protein